MVVSYQIYSKDVVKTVATVAIGATCSMSVFLLQNPTTCVLRLFALHFTLMCKLYCTRCVVVVACISKGISFEWAQQLDVPIHTHYVFLSSMVFQVDLVWDFHFLKSWKISNFLSEYCWDLVGKWCHISTTTLFDTLYMDPSVTPWV